MNYKIVLNEDRKTITVLLTNVSFYYPNNLVEKTADGRYWGNGVFACTPKEVSTFVKECLSDFAKVNNEVQIKAKDIIETEDNPYTLIRYHKDKDGNIDQNQFEISISAYSPDNDKQFFFKDLAKTTPIANLDTIIGHEWGIEMEIKPYKDKKSEEAKIFTVVHRIVMGKSKEGVYKKNDDIWNGFDFGVDEVETEKKPNFPLDDLDDLGF